jgi:ribosomal protein S20
MNRNHTKSVKSSIANKAKHSKARTFLKKVRNFIKDKEKESALFWYRVMKSNLDKLVKDNIIHKNKCNRLKSRVSNQIKNL